ncbi:hypothetical protein BX616_009072 [Lobosporangium transversale]|uniref:Uncharacterized protein n=1 Tax=Lobosporangium transversale TaxID=64571 RepID=A0A1Y2GFC9_9FUNG|nr:hypothetical protein BCR41DRAFT_359726 [Lobosporangium transversale]KAF9918390.1 hypothetical protein BX616_009072 [Lobosporangium transversale]ORZ07975.1 hypothetical protein BCR41DRAFT_359726 [Lobosporangium transversale]|eukprot:XP_021878209.1 hypothetical protein BCR41DRAFT_359726 [Lobosporangium transversale]
MSFAGVPNNGPLSAEQFYQEAINESDAAKRRRLFADARQSNPANYQLWVKAAEVEEHWGADEEKLKDLLTRGVTVFKNPAGASCTENHDHSQHGFTDGPQPVDKHQWLSEATSAQSKGKGKTAAALQEVVGEVL